MIGAGQPQGFIPLHPPPADQDILKRLVQRVSHMKLPRDIGGRDDDGIRLFIRIDLGVEVAALHPEIVDPVLHLARIIGFRQFFSFRHDGSPPKRPLPG